MEPEINPFENVKNRNDIGIGQELLTKEILSKTGEQLIANEKTIRELLLLRGMGSIHNILYETLERYSWEEWFTCLSLELFPEYTIPMMSRVLSVNIFIPGCYYKGEVLWRIFHHDNSIWIKHPNWKPYFEELLKNAFLDYSDNDLRIILNQQMYCGWKELYSKLFP